VCRFGLPLGTQVQLHWCNWESSHLRRETRCPFLVRVTSYVKASPRTTLCDGDGGLTRWVTEQMEYYARNLRAEWARSRKFFPFA
jgi:hypothetical protein